MTDCVFSDNSCKCDELTIIQEKKYSLSQKLNYILFTIISDSGCIKMKKIKWKITPDLKLFCNKYLLKFVLIIQDLETPFAMTIYTQWRGAPEHLCVEFATGQVLIVPLWVTAHTQTARCCQGSFKTWFEGRDSF